MGGIFTLVLVDLVLGVAALVGGNAIYAISLLSLLNMPYHEGSGWPWPLLPLLVSLLWGLLLAGMSLVATKVVQFLSRSEYIRLRPVVVVIQVAIFVTLASVVPFMTGGSVVSLNRFLFGVGRF